MAAQSVEVNEDGSFDLENATEKTIAVLPLGATEQHGPHLPADTDWLIAQELCERLVTKISKEHTELDVRFLPVEKIGYSPEHIGLKVVDGKDVTDSLEYDVAIKKWIETGRQLHSKKVQKLVLLNAHGGNSPLMSIVAQELRVRFDMLAVATGWTRFIKQSPEISDLEQAIGIHGGEIETSVMLAIDPGLVDMSKAENFPSLQEKLIADHTHLRAYGPHSFGWKMSDLNKKGAVGNAKAATAKKGEALIELAEKGIVELVAEINAANPGEIFALNLP